jgi:LuxR family transcriptional regulator, maltose regulon positive regulatory protein
LFAAVSGWEIRTVSTLALRGDGDYARATEKRVRSAVRRAVACELDGEGGAAREWIEQALELAEPELIRRPFLEAGPMVAVLLHRTIRAGTAHRWLAGSLLAVLDAEPAGASSRAARLGDSLSDKERVVLRYLPTMMPNREIAAELFVSVNTVKTHLKSIYRKLDTSNRRETVERARELRLIG